LNNEKSFKNLLSLVTSAPALGVAILTGALALAIPQQLPAQQQPQQQSGSAPVTVTNTQANPLPVVGTINVNGTPTVNAQQSGNWNVGIAGNSATNPLQVHDVDHAPRKSFAKTLRLTMNFGDIAAVGTFDVPTGKRLVIEFFSVKAAIPNNQKLLEASVTADQGGGELGTQVYAPVFTGGIQNDINGIFIVSSGKTHLEAAAGTGTVSVHVQRDFAGIPNVPVISDVFITGYLVDAPQ
jgi:hypothetical protein